MTKATDKSGGKASDPTKWLERAAHIRGLGRGVNDGRIAPMFERLAARLEEIGIAKAEAEMRAKETREGDEAARGGAVAAGEIRGRAEHEHTERER
jgi:hypothetical protein